MPGARLDKFNHFDKYLNRDLRLCNADGKQRNGFWITFGEYLSASHTWSSSRSTSRSHPAVAPRFSPWVPKRFGSSPQTGTDIWRPPVEKQNHNRPCLAFSLCIKTCIQCLFSKRRIKTFKTFRFKQFQKMFIHRKTIIQKTGILVWFGEKVWTLFHRVKIRVQDGRQSNTTVFQYLERLVDHVGEGRGSQLVTSSWERSDNKREIWGQKKFALHHERNVYVVDNCASITIDPNELVVPQKNPSLQTKKSGQKIDSDFVHKLKKNNPWNLSGALSRNYPALWRKNTTIQICRQFSGFHSFNYCARTHRQIDIFKYRIKKSVGEQNAPLSERIKKSCLNACPLTKILNKGALCICMMIRGGDLKTE